MVESLRTVAAGKQLFKCACGVLHLIRKKSAHVLWASQCKWTIEISTLCKSLYSCHLYQQQKEIRKSADISFQRADCASGPSLGFHYYNGANFRTTLIRLSDKQLCTLHLLPISSYSHVTSCSRLHCTGISSNDSSAMCFFFCVACVCMFSLKASVAGFEAHAVGLKN